MQKILFQYTAVPGGVQLSTRKAQQHRDTCHTGHTSCVGLLSLAKT